MPAQRSGPKTATLAVCSSKEPDGKEEVTSGATYRKKITKQAIAKPLELIGVSR